MGEHDRRTTQPSAPLPLSEGGAYTPLAAWSGREMSRRAFLVRGTGTVIVAAAGVALVACGEERAPVPTAPGPRRAFPGVPDTPATPPAGVIQVFTPHEAQTVDALVARIFPGTPEDPGAREAGVLDFITATLAFGGGADATPTYRLGPVALAYEGDTPPPNLDPAKQIAVPKEQLDRYGYQGGQPPQEEYRAGLARVDAYARQLFSKDFVDLAPADQDRILADMANDRAAGFGMPPSARGFFSTLRQHTVQGMFSDPAYGGNREMVGWKLIGFPGPQGAYTPAEMQREGTPRQPQPKASVRMEMQGRGGIRPVSGSR